MKHKIYYRIVHMLMVVFSLHVSAAPADVVAVVSSKSTITTLTADQLSDIYLGRSGRLPNGTPAIPCDLSEDSTLRAEFYTKLLGKSPAQIKSHWAKLIFTGRGQPPQEVATSEEAKRLLGEKPNVICYIDRTQVDQSVTVIFPK